MQFLYPFSAVTKTSSRNYGKASNLRPVRMNDMPVPEGDFMTHYNKRQQVHHTVLALGITMVSIGLALVSVLKYIFFHD